MAKKTQKLKPDTVLKNYWSDNAQFADLFNAVLFDGREVIKPDELEDIDTEESSILEHRKYAESLTASRDNIKVCKKSSAFGVDLVLLGMEGQEHIHYAMPIRNMGYDYSAYKKQYDSNAKKYKTAEGLEEDEYLSGMKKTDKFIPVITVTVYYGEKPWDGAVSLHELLDIPKEFAEYVNDYKIHLIEARQNNLTLRNINNVDFFNLLEILQDRGHSWNEIKNRAIDYATEHHVDKTVVMTVAGVSNHTIDYNALDKKGDAGMYAVFEETRREGAIEGRREGKIEGRIEGVIKILRKYNESDDTIVQELMSEFSFTEDEAEECLDKYNQSIL